MKVYLANLGYKNVFWPICKSENVLTLETSERLLDFWRNKDKSGWLNWATNNERMTNGQLAISAVASRWYNLLTIFHETEADTWIHRDGDHLFWTNSLKGKIEYTTVPDSENSKRTSLLMKRPTASWKDRSKDGRLLLWRSLHPKAHHFLQSEMTYQEIANDRRYRDYALSLIEGPPLVELETQTEWLEARGKKTTVKSFSNLEKTLYQAILTIKGTVKRSDGRIVESKAKIKNLDMSEEELFKFLEHLYREQQGICMLTGLKMLLIGEEGSKDLRLSIDRIDSDGHYNSKNIQLVCQFANLWKSNSNNGRFLELIGLVKASD